MHEWFNDGQSDSLDAGFSERSRPAEDQAGDRLPQDLCCGAANDQTHLLEGGDVDMAHLNRLVLQNQQTRALPEWQQGSGIRSSNS